VRDLGVTLFGNQSFGEDAHLKYYLGAYDGAQAANEDNLRFTARAQLNLLGKEAAYYNDGTYLGEKRTIGIGAPTTGRTPSPSTRPLEEGRLRALVGGPLHRDAAPGRLTQRRGWIR